MAVAETLDAVGVESGVVVGSLRRDEGGLDQFLVGAAELWVRGVPVDWTPLLASGRRVDLPTYAFQHQRYWLEVGAKPVPAGAFTGRSLFQLEWTSQPVSSTPQPARWAIIGADDGGLGVVGDTVAVYDDLAALAAAGDPIADWVLVPCPYDTSPYGTSPDDAARELASATHAAVHRTLALAQAWLADERFAAAKIVLLTRGAVTGEPRGQATDLAGAALWGLVRSAHRSIPAASSCSTWTTWTTARPPWPWFPLHWKPGNHNWLCAPGERSCRGWRKRRR
nr:hypothetical protein [Frankia sp. Cas3]